MSNTIEMVNECIQVNLKDFKTNQLFEEFLSNCKSETIEVKLDEDKITNLESINGYSQENGPFYGVWKGLLTTSIVTNDSIILKRVNVRSFIDELERLLIEICKNVVGCKVDVTDEIVKFKNQKNRFSEGEFKLITKKVFSRILESGYKFDGFRFKMIIENERIYINRELDAFYAAEFKSSRNKPILVLYKIDEEKTKELGYITKENCSEIDTFKYEDHYEKFKMENIDEDKVFVLNSEYDVFYSFGDTYFVKLTSSMVDKWWNYDCRDIFVRHTVNNKNSKNYFGRTTSYLTSDDNALLEVSFLKTYVYDDITHEEYKAICKGCVDSDVAKAIRNKIAVRNATKEEIREIDSKLTRIENEIQEVIDLNIEYILKDIKYDYNSVSGFIRFTPSGNEKDFDDLFQKAQALDLRDTKLKIHIPQDFNSCSSLHEIGEKVEHIVKEKLGIGITYLVTMWD